MHHVSPRDILCLGNMCMVTLHKGDDDDDDDDDDNNNNKGKGKIHPITGHEGPERE